MYSIIYHPITRKQYSIESNIGKKIIKSYINLLLMNGGSTAWAAMKNMGNKAYTATGNMKDAAKASMTRKENECSASKECTEEGKVCKWDSDKSLVIFEKAPWRWRQGSASCYPIGDENETADTTHTDAGTPDDTTNAEETNEGSGSADAKSDKTKQSKGEGDECKGQFRGSECDKDLYCQKQSGSFVKLNRKHYTYTKVMPKMSGRCFPKDYEEIIDLNKPSEGSASTDAGSPADATHIEGSTSTDADSPTDATHAEGSESVDQESQNPPQQKKKGFHMPKMHMPKINTSAIVDSVTTMTALS